MVIGNSPIRHRVDEGHTYIYICIKNYRINLSALVCWCCNGEINQRNASFLLNVCLYDTVSTYSDYNVAKQLFCFCLYSSSTLH